MANKWAHGFAPQVGLGALASGGMAVSNSGHTADGGWDWAAPASGLGGLVAGGGAGYLLGKRSAGLLGKQQIAQKEELASLNKRLNATKAAAKKTALTKELKELKATHKKINSGYKTKALTWLAKDPKASALLGAGLGGLAGATMLSRAMAGPRDQRMAADQQQFAQQDAQNQMRDMQLAYGGNGRNW